MTVTHEKKKEQEILSSGGGAYTATKQLEEIVDARVKGIEDKIDRSKADFITVFGIFASIVTFLSIEIQFLRTVCDYYRLVGFTLIILGALVSFICVLQYIAKTWIKSEETKKTIVEFLLVLLLASVLIFTGITLATKHAGSEFECDNTKLIKELNNSNETLNKYINEVRETRGY